jgi:hypothetical protein
MMLMAVFCHHGAGKAASGAHVRMAPAAPACSGTAVINSRISHVLKSRSIA